MNKKTLIALITLVSVIPLASSDIYLPALPEIAKDYSEEIMKVQWTLSSYLLGLSLFQLIYGIFSDRYGRRICILSGLILYSIGSLGCTLSPTLSSLIFFRAIQAIGACGGLVIGRAIIGDLYSKQEAAKILSIVYPCVGLSPAIAPILGGIITTSFGWRTLFGILTGIGTLTFFLFLMYLPETVQKTNSHQQQNLTFQTLRVTFGDVLSNSQFLGYTFTIIAAYSAYFAYLAEAPFLLDTMVSSTHLSGFLYSPLAISYVISTLIGRKLVQSLKLDQVIMIGCGLFMIGGIVLLCSAISGITHPFGLVLPMTIVTAGNGLIISFSMAGAVTLSSRSVGLVSGLVGTLQVGGASLAAALIGYLRNGTPLPLASLIFGITASALLIAYFTVYSQPMRTRNLETIRR